MQHSTDAADEPGHAAASPSSLSRCRGRLEASRATSPSPSSLTCSPSAKPDDCRAPPSPWLRAHAASELLRARQGVRRAPRRRLPPLAEGIEPRSSVASAPLFVSVDGRRAPSTNSSPSRHPQPRRRVLRIRGEQALSFPLFPPSFSSSRSICHESRARWPPRLNLRSLPRSQVLTSTRVWLLEFVAVERN